MYTCSTRTGALPPTIIHLVYVHNYCKLLYMQNTLHVHVCMYYAHVHVHVQNVYVKHVLHAQVHMYTCVYCAMDYTCTGGDSCRDLLTSLPTNSVVPESVESLSRLRGLTVGVLVT